MRRDNDEAPRRKTVCRGRGTVSNGLGDIRLCGRKYEIREPTILVLCLVPRVVAPHVLLLLLLLLLLAAEHLVEEAELRVGREQPKAESSDGESEARHISDRESVQEKTISLSVDKTRVLRRRR
jgi:hypothetical protein